VADGILKLMNKTWISAGDVIDLFYKIKQKGINILLSKLRFTQKARTVSKWNTVTASADFWILHQVRLRLNEKCTGHRYLEYEDYVVAKYLTSRTGLHMLSVGCGTGSRERKFAKYPNFSLIEGIDLAENKTAQATKLANEANLDNIVYHSGDFEKHDFKPASFDVILFNASLHHFNHVDKLLELRVLPMLKDDGLLVLFEYVGPKRLQWTKHQLEYTNSLLKEIPVKYKTRAGSNSIKKRVYRPGLLRMLITDPSEAIDSESIIRAVHKHFTVIEEKHLGWDILHLLLKDIAHHFISGNPETQKLLQCFFEKEDEYMTITGRSDGLFGIYQKKKRH
jgi:ubiquinone/menaquinone biosynthesis C-methylase UbiE